jgi:hypothetical protein
MNVLGTLFTQKNESITSYADFWAWFQKNEKGFFKAVSTHRNVERDFFDRLSPKLDELKDGYFFLTGMCDDHTAELIITADGAVKNIVFVEELVAAAPQISGWKFTALKPATPIEHVAIEMDGYRFDADNLFFYADELPAYPDEIQITIVYNGYKEKDKVAVTNGAYIFIDNFIGELNCVTIIDRLTVEGNDDPRRKLIPIAKLKDYLVWRQKEFTEKYEGVFQHGEDASHSILEAELENGKYLIAVINTDMLNWENKASHPWILAVSIPYDGTANNGLPDNETYQSLDALGNAITEDLKDLDGYLNIGRQTADNVREIYFACKDFRKPAKVLHRISTEFPDRKITYDIYKDKYWRSFDRFNPAL